MDRKSGKFVDVDGIRTRYFEAGSGETVLLVPDADQAKATQVISGHAPAPVAPPAHGRTVTVGRRRNPGHERL